MQPTWLRRCVKQTESWSLLCYATVAGQAASGNADERLRLLEHSMLFGGPMGTCVCGSATEAGPVHITRDHRDEYIHLVTDTEAL